MINTKKDLQYYLACDRIALGKRTAKPSLFGDEIWKFQICMRKAAYYSRKGGLLKWYYRFKYHKLSVKLGFSIPCDVIGANAVVTKDVPPGVTVGGVPAKIISENDSSKHLIKATEIIDNGETNHEKSV